MQEISAIPNATQSYVLVDEPGYRIALHTPEAATEEPKRLVITFGTLQSGIENFGFGTGFALKNGHPTVYVSPRRGSQYQELSMEAFFDAVSPVIGVGRPAVYGASLGAYAAVYFGGAIDADIIAAAPQCPAMPELHMKHAQTTPMLHDRLIDVPKTTGKVVVFWDPHERPDSILVNDFIRPLYPLAKFLTFPYAGHKILETMSRGGVLKSFIRPLLLDTTVKEISLSSEGNPIWHCNVGKDLLRRGLIREALNNLEISFELSPSPENIQLLAKIFFRYRMMERAKQMVDRIEADPAVKKVTFGPAQRNLEATLKSQEQPVAL